MIKIKNLKYLEYWNGSNIRGWAMLQKLPGCKFEQIEETSQFNEDFIKSYNEESDESY